MIRRLLGLLFGCLLSLLLLASPASACEACAAYGSDLSDAVGSGDMTGDEAMDLLDEWLAEMHPS